MANQTITHLPDACPITGTELVSYVQNGGTHKKTNDEIPASTWYTLHLWTGFKTLQLPNRRLLARET